MIDAEDFERVSAYKWTALWSPFTKTFYASKAIWIDGKRTSISMHRFIINAKRGTRVDHQDGNTLNNRRLNIRLATASQNSANSKISTRRKDSKYKGVYQTPNSPRWYARIKVNGKLMHLGGYAVEEDAAIAYNEAAVKYFGEFARPNQIYPSSGTSSSSSVVSSISENSAS